jgi:hypothetical protein
MKLTQPTKDTGDLSTMSTYLWAAAAFGVVSTLSAVCPKDKKGIAIGATRIQLYFIKRAIKPKQVQLKTADEILKLTCFINFMIVAHYYYLSPAVVCDMFSSALLLLIRAPS